MALTRDDVLNQAKREIVEISIEELKARLDQGGSLFLLDVRGREEVAQGYIEGAVHIPRGFLELNIEQVVQDRSTPMVVYCAGGVRSALAAKTLQGMGYTDVVSMAGGFNDWRDAGFPVAQPEPENHGVETKAAELESEIEQLRKQLEEKERELTSLKKR
jgi:adenylyltransferase/sulfurtransferase